MVRWQELSANEMTLLDRVFRSSGISRDALAVSSSLSKSRATAAVAGMLEQGVLEQTGGQVSTGGRRAETPCLTRNLGVVLAVAMGATGFEVAVLTPDFEVLARAPAAGAFDAVFDKKWQAM